MESRLKQMHDCSEGITGIGAIPAKVMFIGTGAGRTEWNTGSKIPFIGPPGKLLKATAKATGWDTEKDTFFTNMICGPSNGDELTDEQIEQCLPRLQAEIEAVNPNLIVMLGVSVSKYLLGQKKFRRGRMQWRGNRWYLPTHHPSAFTYNEAYKYDVADFARDMYKLSIFADNKEGPPKIDYTVAQSAEEAEAILWSLKGITAIDVETSYDGLPFNYPNESLCGNVDSRLLCLAVSNNQGTWVIPGKFFIDIRPGWGSRENVQWLMHLGMFDKAKLRDILGEELELSEDTLLESYSLDERAGEAEENSRAVGVHGLKLLSSEFLGAEDYDVKVLEADIDDLHKYNAYDVRYTRMLHDYFEPRQVQDNVRNMYKNILIPGANALSEIQAYGVHIDKEVMYDFGARWTERWVELYEELISEALRLGWDSREEFNLNSPQHRAKLIYDHIGVAPHKIFGRSTRKEVLEELATFVPWCATYREWSNINHTLNAYVTGVEDDIKYDGRVHAQPVLHGTKGGRLSYKKPPVQQIPKHGVDAEMAQIRKEFAATNDDYVIIEADLKQAEMWAVAYLANDEDMLHALSTGDAHGITTKEVFNIDETFEYWTAYRELGKLLNLGTLYNRTAKGYAKNMWQGRKPPKGLENFRWTVSQAQKFINKWYEKYGAIKTWQQSQIREAFDTGEQVTRTGRKRRYWLPSFKTVNQSVNIGPQSLSHDNLFDSLVKLHHSLAKYDAHILYEVHDSLIIEARKSHLEQSLPLIKTTMTEPKFGFGGIPVDISMGNNWYEVVKVSV